MNSHALPSRLNLEEEAIPLQLLPCALPEGIAEREARRIDKLTADAELVQGLMLSRCDGPEWLELREALAAYGFVVCRAWIGDGKIFMESAKKGLRGVFRHPLVQQHAEDLAIDTVISALNYFRDKVLLGGVWKPEGGASLSTFFIGACVYRFRNVFRDWRRQERRFRSRIEGDLALTTDKDPNPAADEIAIARQRLSSVDESPIAEIAAHLLEGCTQEETAKRLGLSEGAVRSRLERFRKKAS